MTVNNPPSQQQQQPPATSVDISNISPSSSGGPQTLADLKKQRSMNRVAQQNSPQAPIRENSSNSSDQHHQHTVSTKKKKSFLDSYTSQMGYKIAHCLLIYIVHTTFLFLEHCATTTTQ